jgi:hypothetical protein
MTVTVRNAGQNDAGEFAIAANMPPNNVFTSVIVPGLPAGQSANVEMSGTLNNTGVFSVEVVADLNTQVTESETGEQNNVYQFNYLINKTIIEQDTVMLNPGEAINLEGDAIPEDQRQDDVMWDGNMLTAVGSTRLGIIQPGNNGFDWLNTGIDEANQIYWNMTNPDVVSRIQYDLIDPNTVITQPQIDRASLTPGTLLGVITAEGRRSIVRLDELPESNQLDLTYLVYQQ